MTASLVDGPPGAGPGAGPGASHRPDVPAELLALLRRYAAQVDRQARFPAEGLAALRNNGYLGYLVPAEYGGMGGDLGGLVSVAQALAGACVSTAMIWAMHCQQVDVLVRHGGTRLRRRLLPQVAAGKVYLGSVTTESGKGGHLMSAREPLTAGDPADPADDGKLVLRRHAPVCTGGAHADGYLITMRADEASAEHSVSLVYADRAELTVRPTGVWNPLGMRGTHSGPIHLSGLVDTDQIVGEPGHFREVAVDSMIPVGHLGWSACWLGAARQAFADLVRHLARDGRTDLTSPLVRERIARIRFDLDLVSACLHRVREEMDTAREAGRRMDTPAAQIHVNTLKLAASELSFRAVDRMVQLAGLSLGYSGDSPIPLERTFRDLRSAALNYANDRLWTANGALALLDRRVTLL
ncbi:acyl-CoA dehydrogenase family protein [Streptomyces sp. NPDC047841]|uniref:acyl-CoA dehydrogenase family protein n=1 Tax=Streptomyces sp. NPDC047841 TaxID=3154708 RepID=UPI0034524E93